MENGETQGPAMRAGGYPALEGSMDQGMGDAVAKETGNTLSSLSQPV